MGKISSGAARRRSFLLHMNSPAPHDRVGYNECMDVRVKATDYELTADTRSYLDERIQSVAKLLGNDADLARVEVEVGRAAGGQRHGDNLFFAEFDVSIPGDGRVHATNNASTINAAIDDVKEEILRQLRKRKTVHQRVIRKGGAMLKNIMRFGGQE